MLHFSLHWKGELPTRTGGVTGKRGDREAGAYVPVGVALERQRSSPSSRVYSQNTASHLPFLRRSVLRACEKPRRQRLSLKPLSLCNLSHGARSHGGSTTHFFPQTHTLLLRILEYLPPKTSAHATIRIFFSFLFFFLISLCMPSCSVEAWKQDLDEPWR